MTKACKNCGRQVDDNFCPSCGQRTSTAKFDVGYLSRSVIDLFDVDRGFIKATIDAAIRPGQAMREYVDGQRVSFYNPLKFFLITGAIATLLINYWGNPFDESTGNSDLVHLLQLPGMQGFFSFSAKYLTFWMLNAVPLFALTSYLIFKRSGRNFIENLIFNVYVAGGQYLLIIIAIPFLHSFEGVVMGSIYGVVNQAYNIWALIYFFNVKNIKGLVMSLLAIAIPGTVALIFNYGVYMAAPQVLWDILDVIFS